MLYFFAFSRHLSYFGWWAVLVMPSAVECGMRLAKTMVQSGTPNPKAQNTSPTAPNPKLPQTLNPEPQTPKPLNPKP